MDRLTITFLGTGTSHGVPTVDCMMDSFSRCPKGVCLASESDRKHRRTRSSILVSFRGKNTLIDASADFREQVLRQRVDRIDSLIITHHHADHIMGVPDIRSFSRVLPEGLPVYGSSETVDSLHRTFSYIFREDPYIGGGIPALLCEVVDKPFFSNEIEWTPLPVEHGDCSGCYGYRFFDIVYMPDVKSIPESTFELMMGAKLLIIDALRPERPHETHMIIPESLEVAKRVGAKEVLFTHLCHDIHYIDDAVGLPEGVDFAYDGLQIEI